MVVIGVPGLQWSDLDQARTPNLWGLVAKGGAASLSTRTIPPEGLGITCPIAGWLTVSAGQRAGSQAPAGQRAGSAAPADERAGTPAGERAESAGAGCALPPEPAVAADSSGSASIPGWADLVAFQEAGSFKARIGLLGQTVADAGGKIAAIGPGAALGAADKSGKIQKYAATPAELADFSPYNLVFAEAGEISRAWIQARLALSDEAREQAVSGADRTVGEILQRVPSGSTVLVAGLSDASTVAHLHVALATGPSATIASPTTPSSSAIPSGPNATGSTITTSGSTTAGPAAGGSSATVSPGGTATPSTNASSPPAAEAGSGESGREPYRHGLLTATSTRQDALVTITDQTATVLGVLGLDTPEGVVGRAWADGGAGPATVDATVTRLADADLASQVLKQVREPFFISLVALQLLFYGLAAIVVRRLRGSGEGEPRTRILAATQVVAVVSGAIPVSTFLAQLVPWWSVPHPMLALVATILAFAGLIAGVAFAGPWRAHVLGPLTVVAGVSSLALLIDVMAGSRLQVNAVTGYEPVTGGRFYGFGNMAFAIYSTGTIMALAGIAQALIERGRRAPALIFCLVYGLLAIFADGWPEWGADFGGVPSFVLGFAVFMLMVSGRRVSIGKLAVVGLAGAVLIGLIATADWLRPADRRTHLGAFVQQLIEGEGGSVVGRKLGAMLSTLGNLPLTLLSMVALAFLFLVLSRPSNVGAAALNLAYGYAPALRAGLFGALTAGLVGFLINDSGIAIPAMALTVAVPLTLAASVRALQLSASGRSTEPTRRGRPSAPAGSTAPPAT